MKKIENKSMIAVILLIINFGAYFIIDNVIFKGISANVNLLLGVYCLINYIKIRKLKKFNKLEDAIKEKNKHNFQLN